MTVALTEPAQDVGQRAVLDVTGQTVTAEQKPGATPERAAQGVHDHLLATPQGTDQHIAVLVRAGFCRTELAKLDQPGNQGVITRQLMELAPLPQIYPAVPDPGYSQALVLHHGGDHSGAQASRLAMLLCIRQDGPVCSLDRFAHPGFPGTLVPRDSRGP